MQTKCDQNVALHILRRAALAAAASVFLVAFSANAHVGLDEPNGGEVFVVGSTETISWHDVVAHGPADYDLWYSTSGPGGPWIEIVADLVFSSGVPYTFDWIVPDDASTQVRVRVRQDNAGTDYEDISDGNLTIKEALFIDGFETGEMAEWSAIQF